MAYDTKQRMQPLVALRAIRTLLSDPERTDQVFLIIRAMSGNALKKAYARFLMTSIGKTIVSEQRELLSVLQDREALEKLDPGTLGRHYLNFTERESISADGLVAASEEEQPIKDPGLHLYAERTRDMHDLWHVITDYGRDTFGESCLLAFTYAQTRNRGVGVIALVGLAKLTKEIGSGVGSAMWQAYLAGRKAEWLPAQDWEYLLTRPLQEVRETLNIDPPEKYQEKSDSLKMASA
jgi:ubiquinone biosynthesis protein COQ4